MSDEIQVIGSGKRERYESLYPQLKALLLGEDDLIANMANVAAALKEGFGFFWVGFYRVLGDQLVLGPFQGPVACSRIAYGKGVCGTAWKEGRVVVVPDVDRFPGHIACSSLSRSEIVVPVWSGDRVIAVLDVDSDQLDAFNEIDAYYLEKVCALLSGEKRTTV
ncbi:MAG: GAF domain-containing protein [Fermentimonas sp.]|jgi:GAF domain-containing protein